MLSSPRPMSSSCKQVSKASKEPTANDKRYHRMVYADGRRRYIVESHRAVGSSRGVDANASRRSHHCLVIHTGESVPSKRSTSQGSPSLSSSRTSSPAQKAALAPSRDMYDIDSPNLSKAGTFILESLGEHPVAVEVDGRVKARTWEEPTPPPTPVLGRLPSPEIPDLDEAPFCECDEAILMPYCSSCKKEARCAAAWK